MTESGTWERSKRIFAAALERPPEERQAFLDRECEGNPELRERIAALLRVHLEPDSVLDRPRIPPPEWSTGRRASRSAAGELRRVGRFELLDCIGAGGMGVVYRARQEHPRRTVALKLIRPGFAGPSLIGRFAREVSVLGRLQHRGIARIYDAGTTEVGGGEQPYFAMELVEGPPLDEFARRAAIDTRRRIELLIEVCGAVHHAHQKGVIHRDLKPANILVDASGQPKVLDFGVARATDDEAFSDGGARTMSGQIVGTVPYMSPEQIRGDRDAIDTRSDIYSLGVVAYELLTGELPYAVRGANLVEAARVVGLAEPVPAGRHKRELRGDLETILSKALEKEPDRRYPSAAELAEDFARVLRDEPIAARPPSTLYQLRKFSRRHRALVMGLAAFAVALVVGFAATVRQWVRAEAAETRAVRNFEQAERLRRAAAERADEVFRLSARSDLERLLNEARRLWPVHPDRIPEYDAWLADVETLAATLPALRETLAQIRSRALPYTEEDRARDASAQSVEAEIAALEKRLSELEEQRRKHDRGTDGLDQTERDAQRRSVELRLRFLEDDLAELRGRRPERLTWRFSLREDRWWHGELARLVGDLEAAFDSATGIVDGISPEHGMGVGRRRVGALELARLAAEGMSDAWRRAAREVRGDPRTAGLDLKPQIGLVPLGRDPDSGLQEFLHVLSGAAPARDSDTGRWRIRADTGIILVLVPGGTFRMGALENDRDTTGMSRPVHEVNLDPYFLSRYELTQAQWERLTGDRPSSYADRHYIVAGAAPTHPVESLSHARALDVLSWVGLTLPTEAQWERAARGGDDRIWPNGNTIDDLRGHVNIGDEKSRRFYPANWPYERGFFDDFVCHNPVDALSPNPYGLHGMTGNVSEWCRDRFGEYDRPAREGDGERIVPPSEAPNVAYRGGSFVYGADSARCAARNGRSPLLSDPMVGVRPARALDSE